MGGARCVAPFHSPGAGKSRRLVWLQPSNAFEHGLQRKGKRSEHQRRASAGHSHSFTVHSRRQNPLSGDNRALWSSRSSRSLVASFAARPLPARILYCSAHHGPLFSSSLTFRASCSRSSLWGLPVGPRRPADRQYRACGRSSPAMRSGPRRRRHPRSGPEAAPVVASILTARKGLHLAHAWIFLAHFSAVLGGFATGCSPCRAH